MNKTKFGAYIKESRIKKNYTQQELANLLFVEASTVSKWERGVSYPDITFLFTCYEYASFLFFSLFWLVKKLLI